MYGLKYCPNIGTYQMPYLYVKTLFMCATGGGLHYDEMHYIRGLVDVLLPCKTSYVGIKRELLEYVDSVPLMSGPPRQPVSSRSDSSRLPNNTEDTFCMDGNGTSKIPESLSKGEDAEGNALSFLFSRDVDHQECGNFPQKIMCSTKEPIPNMPMRGNNDVALFRSNLELAMKFISREAFPPALSRILLYDAVCACVADNVYTAKERERVALVATQIGLSPSVREPIERLALQEKALSNRKRVLLHLHREEDIGTTTTSWTNLPGEAPAEKRIDKRDMALHTENNSYKCIDKVGARVGNYREGVSCSTRDENPRNTHSRLQTSAEEGRSRSFNTSFASPLLAPSDAAASSVCLSFRNKKDLLQQAKALLRQVQRG
ncbi:unnamed protein product [Phytomonas sp. Hart1]|nr:unnamed protein product [Phytomonas sp. Hart1]|eukprot:CCW68310.1 unnamed protein product [Phytomonas sp. isolate Hart1]